MPLLRCQDAGSYDQGATNPWKVLPVTAIPVQGWIAQLVRALA